MADKSEEGEENDPNNFSGIEETLVEARRRFDNEESRRDSIKQSIGIIVTADALLISLGTLFLDDGSQTQSLVSLAPALISALIGLFVIKPKYYLNPLEEADEYYNYVRQEPEYLYDTFLISYINSIRYNRSLNNLQISFLHLCTSLTVLTVVLLVFTQSVSDSQILILVVFLIPHIISGNIVNQLSILTVSFSQIF